ncbi:MAG: peptide deformylase [Microbacteriaceae bacterium]
MAALPIRISGDPVLHSAARPVTQFDENLRTLVSDMFQTMDAAPGVGLAAPQIGVPLRVFVYGWEDDSGDAPGTVHRGVAINPELWITPTRTGAAREEDEDEGCLSFPGERFPLVRADSAILRAVDLEQHSFELRADGWLARIFQHEFDHLNGVLYTDRLEHPHAKDAAKILRKRSWGVPGQSWLPGVDDLQA